MRACPGCGAARSDSGAMRRWSGAVEKSEFVAIPGLQRITDVLRCARDKQPYFPGHTRVTWPILRRGLGLPLP